MMYMSPLVITSTLKDTVKTGIPDLMEIVGIISDWEGSFQQGLTDPVADTVICKLYELACIVYGKELLENILNEQR